MSGLRVVLHAVDADGLARARNNARNLAQAAPDATWLIVANAGAVAAALATPDAATDPALRLCANTLRKLGVAAPAHIATVPAAVLELAQRQQAGWHYVRA